MSVLEALYSIGRFAILASLTACASFESQSSLNNETIGRSYLPLDLKTSDTLSDLCPDNCNLTKIDNAMNQLVMNDIGAVTFGHSPDFLNEIEKKVLAKKVQQKRIALSLEKSMTGPLGDLEIRYYLEAIETNNNKLWKMVQDDTGDLNLKQNYWNWAAIASDEIIKEFLVRIIDEKYITLDAEKFSSSSLLNFDVLSEFGFEYSQEITRGNRKILMISIPVFKLGTISEASITHMPNLDHRCQESKNIIFKRELHTMNDFAASLLSGRDDKKQITGEFTACTYTAESTAKVFSQTLTAIQIN